MNVIEFLNIHFTFFRKELEQSTNLDLGKDVKDLKDDEIEELEYFFDEPEGSIKKLISENQ